MRDVFVAGIGRTRITQDGTSRGRYVAASALNAAIEDAQIEKNLLDSLYVSNMSSGVLGNQQQLGAVIADVVGLSGKEAMVIEAACASGAAASRQAYLMVASGIYDVVAVCGVERMIHPSVNKDDITKALALASDWETEGSKGATFLSLNAKLMNAYLEKYKIDRNAFAPFAINAHKNALGNPHAMFHKEITFEQYSEGKEIIPPLRLFDVSPVCNGAAAIIFASAEGLRKSNKHHASLVRIVASSMATSRVALVNREDILHLSAVEISTKQVLASSGMSLSNLDIFELHDAYSIMSVLSLESAGYARPGQGVHLGSEGRIAASGDIPIATMGGLKARGHPIGATGVYQLVEAYLQLSGQAGNCQIQNATTAMVQNIGGVASTVVSHILERKA